MVHNLIPLLILKPEQCLVSELWNPYLQRVFPKTILLICDRMHIHTILKIFVGYVTNTDINLRKNNKYQVT